MASALEKLGLTPADLGASAARPAAPAGGAGSALSRLGLTPADLGQTAPGQAAAGDQLGLLSSGALGAAQGVTFGGSDELAGVVSGIGSALSGEGFGPGYERGTEYVRGLHDRAQPGAFLAGDIAGSLVLPGGAVRSGATLAAKAGRAALAGAGQGAAGAFGRAERGIAERAPEAAAGAVAGAALGGVVGAALPIAGRGVQNLARRAAPESVDEAGDAALQAIRTAAERGKKGVDEAYEAVANLEGKIEGESAFQLLQQRLTRVLDEGGFNYVPGVGAEIGKVVNKITSDLAPTASLQQLEGARKGLNRAIGSLSNDPARRSALTAIKGEFDDWMLDAITNGLYRGDPDAIDVLKSARGLNTEYQRLFGVGGRTTQNRAAGRIIDQLINDDVGPGEAVSYLFGANAIGIKASRKAVARIRDISPEALEQMKVAHFNKILAPNGADFDSGVKIANRIQKLNANQTQMMKIVYGEDLGSLNRFAAQLKRQQGGVAQSVANFFASKPGWVRAAAVATGVAGTSAAGGGMVENSMAALLLTGLTRRGSNTGAISRAARPFGSTLPARAGRLGGLSPSLAGGQ